MALVSLSGARLAFGHHPLLDHAEFQLDPRERVGLIGRNGSGKSSLLKVIAGLVQLDDGEAWRAPEVRIGYAAQEPDLDPASTIYDAVTLGLGAPGRLLADYHHAVAILARDEHDPRRLAEVGTLHGRLDAADGWALGHRVDAVLSQFDLPADTVIGLLSGGARKRVALAQALAASPDVLLLDEPTNHLDIGAIAWLETLLRDYPGAIVCVTHDRRFLDAVVTRIVELDRGRLRDYPGNFAAYQERKAREANEEAVASAKFDKVLAQEEAWIRKGVEARRTRNEGRVRRLEALRRERAARRERLGQVNLRVDDGARSGQMVAELTAVAKSYGGRVLIRDFTTRILRGDRIGLIGPNGAGKTTLLKLILGEIEPDAGTVRRGANLSVAYFDQLRDRLDPEATVQGTITPGADWVVLGDQRRHVISYLGDFLFAPERARSPVSSLSGGERNRLLLARLFAQPANVLVLDEPTNDLDIETLELLEALLQEYRGTIFLVSHDRAFLDNVVTQVIAFEGDGVLQEHVGGYSDWVAWRARRDGTSKATARGREAGADARPAGAAPARHAARPARSGLSFNEARELAGLPPRIEALEARVAAIRTLFADPALYRDAAQVKALRAELAQAEADLAADYARWEALEARA